jgi:hypothetical protein
MKKQIASYVASLGGSTAYSGHTRTMYVKGLKDDAQTIENGFLLTIGYGSPFNLPFKLVTN